MDVARLWLALGAALYLLIGGQQADGYYFSNTKLSNSMLLRYYLTYRSSYFSAYYRYYFGLYSTVARSSAYRKNNAFHSSRQCANFEVNVYGDYLAYFACPLSFEPSGHRYCCGVQYVHFCCANESWATPITSVTTVSVFTSFPVIVGITFGGLVGIVVLGGLVWLLGVSCYLCCCNKTRSRVTIAPQGGQPRSRTIFSSNTNRVSFISEPPPYVEAPPSYCEVTGHTAAAPTDTPLELPTTPPPRYESAAGQAMPSVS